MLWLDLKPHVLSYYSKKPVKVWTPGNQFHQQYLSLSRFRYYPLTSALPVRIHRLISGSKSESTSPREAPALREFAARDPKAQFTSPGGFLAAIHHGTITPSTGKGGTGLN